jgi:hypothetical protein
VDDLWALALANLSALPPYESRVNDRAALTGRALEPWRALLATALWLDENGLSGLWDRMEKLSVGYQEERGDMESGDLTVLVIRALCRVAGCDISDIRDVSDIKGEGKTWTLKTSQITETAKEIAEELELDVKLEDITSRRIGRVLGKMRFKKARESGKGTRLWQVSPEELQGWICSQGLIVTKSDDTPSTNVTDVTNVTNVTADEPLDEVEQAEEAALLDYYSGQTNEEGRVVDDEGNEYHF